MPFICRRQYCSHGVECMEECQNQPEGLEEPWDVFLDPDAADILADEYFENLIRVREGRY